MKTYYSKWNYVSNIKVWISLPDTQKWIKMLKGIFKIQFQDEVWSFFVAFSLNFALSAASVRPIEADMMLSPMLSFHTFAIASSTFVWPFVKQCWLTCFIKQGSYIYIQWAWKVYMHIYNTDLSSSTLIHSSSIIRFQKCHWSSNIWCLMLECVCMAIMHALWCMQWSQRTPVDINLIFYSYIATLAMRHIGSCDGRGRRKTEVEEIWWEVYNLMQMYAGPCMHMYIEGLVCIYAYAYHAWLYIFLPCHVFFMVLDSLHLCQSIYFSYVVSHDWAPDAWNPFIRELSNLF